MPAEFSGDKQARRQANPAHATGFFYIHKHLAPPATASLEIQYNLTSNLINININNTLTITIIIIIITILTNIIADQLLLPTSWLVVLLSIGEKTRVRDLAIGYSDSKSTRLELSWLDLNWIWSDWTELSWIKLN